MEKVKLTVNFIKKLVPGQSGKFADTEVPGLQVRVGATAVSYYLRKRQGKKVHEIVIGRHPDITLEEARQKALGCLGAIANHQDIQAPAARKQPLVRDAVNLHVKTQANKQSSSSVLKNFSHIYDKKIIDITHEDILSVFESMKETPAAANSAIRHLKAAIGKICRSMQITNPSHTLFSGIKFYPETPRLRVLRENEAPLVIKALYDLSQCEVYSAQADALLVMLYTGQRKSRVLHMNIDQINVELKQWDVPGNNIKRPVTHPFNSKSWEIIEKRIKTAVDGYLFCWRGKPLNDCRKTFKKACEMCNVADMTIHDLRRSLGSWMLSAGASIESVSKTLGHSSIRVTEQVYAHILASKGREDTAAAVDAMIDGKI